MAKLKPSSKDNAAVVTLSGAAHILREVGGTVANRTLDCLQGGRYAEIAMAEMPDPRGYHDADTFARDYLGYNLLRKYSMFPVDIDRVDAAYRSFAVSEETCARINETGLCFAYDPDVRLDLQVTSVLYRAREKICRLLGDFNLDWFLHECGFSKGASTRLRRKDGSPYYKLHDKPHVTANCLPLAVAYAWHHDAWRRQLQDDNPGCWDPTTWFQVVTGSRFTTVPKDSKTDRGINIEPEMNMFFQKGIGNMIRRRLRKAGIDLNDQGANQHLSRLAYFFGYATLDLSRASDSVALELVRFLLPSSWMDYLEMCRSPRVTLNGKTHVLAKIASMGNGYTFELESLIFWSLCSSVSELVVGHGAISVYGDDLIVDRDVAPDLIRVLEAVGFTINRDKSFVEGNFFESCGKHWFKGADVSPFYIKDPVGSLDRLFWLYNTLNEWWTPLPLSRRYVRNRIPNRCRWRVPPSFPSDSGMRGELDECRPSWDRRRQQWRFKFYRQRVKRHDVSSTSHGYLYGLYSMWKTPSASPDVLQGISEVDRTSVVKDKRWACSRAFTSSWT